jgi:Zn-dependent protease with chaperone function
MGRTRSLRRHPPLVALLAFAWVLISVAKAHAGKPPATLQVDAAFEARVDAEVAARDPEAASLFRQANAARDSGQLAQASELYGKAHARAPWFSHAARRQCGTELELGHPTEAVPLCREAYQTDASVENMTALASALAAGTPGSVALSEAETLISGAQKQRPNDPFVLTTHADIALRRQDLDAFRASVTRLLTVAPNVVSTQLFATLLAASEGREEDARAAASNAHALGLDDEAYGRLLVVVHDSVPWTTRAWRMFAKASVVWAGLFGLFLGIGFILSRATLRTASRPPSPNEVGGDPWAGLSGATRAEAALRRVYRTVLWVCCAYYYLSIPLLVLVVLGACAGVVFGMLALGYISIKLILIALVLGYGSVVAIGKSLLVRVKDQEPGTRLDLTTHPRLQEALREVAEQVGTRPVDVVFLTPFTDVAVFDRGSLLGNLRGRSERCLILGAGVLDGMDQRSLKSILAHEYGHFKNEDTAGGGFALSVRRSLLLMTVHLVQRGVATKLNPAWWFVMGFSKLFLRISQGASRLQEILADRWAALVYGSQEFERGLRHVIERSVRFDAHLQATLDDVVPERRPLVNLYRHSPKGTPDEGDLDKKVAAHLEAKPSSYDSHPAPADRIAYVRAMDAPGRPHAEADASPAWDLFEAREAVEKSMTDALRALLEARRGISLPSAPVADAAE